MGEGGKGKYFFNKFFACLFFFLENHRIRQWSVLVLGSVTCQAPRPLWASRGCGHRLFLPSAGECGTKKEPTMKMLLTLEPGVACRVRRGRGLVHLGCTSQETRKGLLRTRGSNPREEETDRLRFFLRGCSCTSLSLSLSFHYHFRHVFRRRVSACVSVRHRGRLVQSVGPVLRLSEHRISIRI